VGFIFKIMLKFLFKVTFQSAILFFAVSFLTVLYGILPDWFNLSRENNYQISIGFPFEYYYQFWLDKISPNHGWNLVYLFYDCLLFWVFTFAIYHFKDKLKLEGNNVEGNDILDN